MVRVNQRRMFRLRGLDEAAAAFRPQRVEADRDQFEPLRMKLAAQRLPPGQVGRAASVGGPGVHEDLAPPQARKPERLPVQIG